MALRQRIFLRRLWRNTTNFGPRSCLTMLALSTASLTYGIPISISSADFLRNKTVVNSSFAPASPSSFSTAKVLPGIAWYCLPPVLKLHIALQRQSISCVSTFELPMCAQKERSPASELCGAFCVCCLYYHTEQFCQKRQIVFKWPLLSFEVNFASCWCR